MNSLFYFERGVPMKEVREVYLALFDRINENNEDQYKIVLEKVFGNSAEKLPSKTPTFRTNENFEEIFSECNFLNDNGIQVRCEFIE